MSKSLFFIYILIMSSQSFARKPAVEPILGISIEEYKEVDPQHAQGYNFESTTKQIKTTTNRIHDTSELEVQSAQDSSGTGGSLLLIFLIFLPIIASGLTFLRYFKKDHSNVVDLDKLRNSKAASNNDDSDDNIPKAS